MKIGDYFAVTTASGPALLKVIAAVPDDPGRFRVWWSGGHMSSMSSKELYENYDAIKLAGKI